MRGWWEEPFIRIEATVNDNGNGSNSTAERYGKPRPIEEAALSTSLQGEKDRELRQEILRQAYRRRDGAPHTASQDATPQRFETVHEASDVAKRWRRIMQDRSASRQLFDFLVRQYQETCSLSQQKEEEIANLMEIQAEEMMALSMDGTTPEIESLVKVHLEAREHKEAQFAASSAELVAKQSADFRKVLNRLDSERVRDETILKDSPNVSLKAVWEEVNFSRTQPSLAEMAPIGKLNDVLGVRTVAKSLGERVVGSWVGVLPETILLVTGRDDGELQAAGIQSPIVGSESALVQLGSGCRVSFRISVVLSAHALCNILDPGKFELWYAHAQALHAPDEAVCAILAPRTSTFTGDTLSKAVGRSAEFHFPLKHLVESLDGNEYKGTISAHSNILGGQVVVRASDVKTAVTLADRARLIERAVIPLELWGTGQVVDMLKQVKGALVICAAERFISGSALSEIVIMVPASDIPSEERVAWLAKMKATLVQVFE